MILFWKIGNNKIPQILVECSGMKVCCISGKNGTQRLRLVNEFQELIHVYVKIRELSSPFHTVSLSRKEIQ